MGCVRNRGEMSPVFLNSGCKSDIVLALRIDEGHGDQRGGMGTLWGLHGFSIALVAQSSKATLFESILKLAKGGWGCRTMNHGGCHKYDQKAFKMGAQNCFEEAFWGSWALFSEPWGDFGVLLTMLGPLCGDAPLHGSTCCSILELFLE